MRTSTLQEGGLISGRFFVSAWKLPQLSQVTKADRCNAALQELLIALPEEFHKAINRVKDHLESILALPWVLMHTDLAAGNMLVDPSTGHLTGVVDCAEATMEPFGLALWGLEDILGSHGPQGYTYSIESKTGYDLFRQIFMSETGFDGDAELLEWARLLGIFIRHCYIWDSILKARVPISQDLDLQLLRICVKFWSLVNY
nr:hypothetical protein CFP56_01128 [Quercus suber]